MVMKPTNTHEPTSKTWNNIIVNESWFTLVSFSWKEFTNDNESVPSFVSQFCASGMVGQFAVARWPNDNNHA
ncbi:unnamed protein product, partial [Sphenostylis stenocarpa]